MDARNQDQIFMAEALREAKKGVDREEVPVGAVIVHDGAVIARAHNLRETSQDPTSHAEMLAIRVAAERLGSWRLCDCTLYVTLEPCLMCMGAIILARIPRLVFGCRDPRAGAAGSLYDLAADDRLNHRVEVTEGVLEEVCSGMLSEFFFSLRRRKKPAT
ncbi:MAG: nucleoside deaminase [Deltaproteobacteria bacterium]|nr:nucleoside deaminase [Deltaproteobacteria bacterium]